MTMTKKEVLNRRKQALKRMLALVAVVNGEEITPTNIWKVMEKAFKNTKTTLSAVVNDERIVTYLGKTKGDLVVTYFPRNPSEQRTYLAAINLALFGSDKSAHFKSFDEPLESHPLWIAHGAEVEEYLSKAPRLQHINNVLVAPDYLPNGIDPAQIDTAIRLKGNRPDNALDPHFLYQSPLAAMLWERIKISESYGTHYHLCEEGLREILRKAEFRQRLSEARLVLNLGVGAPSKDQMILNAMQSLRMSNSVFCWVDASYPMLYRTLRGLDPAAGADIHKIALLADFEDPVRVQRTFDASFGSLHKYAGRKIFFILGFTLSNLREERFLAAYSKHCEEGDVLVFPMQFIPEACRKDAQTMEKFKMDLIELYNFKDGQKLARAGLSISEYFAPDEKTVEPLEPQVRRWMFFDKAESLRLYFQADLVEAGGGVGTVRVTTAESFRHFEDHYLSFLEANGFRKLCESRVRRGVQTIAIERIKEATR